MNRALAAVRPVRGVSFSTAGGAADVRWPLAIGIFTAGEDRLFHEIGDLVELSAEHGFLPASEYGTHRYRTDELRTHGRFVSLVVWNEPFTFVDEIEVYRGDAEWVDEPLPGPAIADLKAYAGRLAIQAGIRGIDRTLADRARVQVLETLSGLTALTAAAPPAARPREFRLRQNHPNPFNPETAIGFSIPGRGRVELAIWNLAGQKVRSLLAAVLEPGSHSVPWDGRDDRGRELATGVYLYRLRAGQHVGTRKLLLLK